MKYIARCALFLLSLCDSLLSAQELDSATLASEWVERTFTVELN